MRGPVVLSLAALATLLTLAPAAGAAGALPAANLPPQPNFDATCQEQAGFVIAGYCTYNPATGHWTVDTPARQEAAIEAIDYARQVEGLGPLLLPRDFYGLDAVDQQFVLINLERVARGLSPLVAVSPALDQAAQAGAAANRDPQTPAAFTPYASGANWSGDAQAAPAIYAYMYLDGWGGSPANTPNLDCPAPGAPGCWGHRLNILGNWGLTGLFGGAAIPAGATGAGDSAQAFVAYTGAPLPVTYTWADALQQGAAGGLATAHPTGPLWPFADLTAADWAAGPAAALFSAGVVEGTGGGNFSPDAQVELQQMIVFLARSLLWPNDPAAAPAGTASYALGAMGYAAAAGLLPAGVAPTSPISRLQTVQLLTIALHLPPASAPMPFSDLGGLTANQLQVLTTGVADGLIQGEGSGILAPEQVLTRAQAVVMLQRTLLLRARSAGTVVVNGQPLTAQDLPGGWKLYRLGPLRLLAASATQDPFLYWLHTAGSEPLLAEAGGSWWSGTFSWQSEPIPSWATPNTVTLYGRAQALLWPAGQQGVGPALFGPTAHVIGFGQDVQQLLPGAAAWAPAPSGTATDPLLAVAGALD